MDTGQDGRKEFGCMHEENNHLHDDLRNALGKQAEVHGPVARQGSNDSLHQETLSHCSPIQSSIEQELLIVEETAGSLTLVVVSLEIALSCLYSANHMKTPLLD